MDRRPEGADVSEALAVPEVIEGELAQVPANLFGTSDPVVVVEQATKIASALADVLKKKNLAKTISGRSFVLVEGWTLLGTMLGVFPVVEWTRPIEGGWEARVEARTLNGQVVGSAESECLRSEKNWAKRDDYALRSMAQTRAVSKALRGPLGFIVTLAGYEAIPADEMPESLSEPEGVPPAGGSEPSSGSESDEARRLAIGTLESAFKHAKEHGSLPPGHENWDEYLKWYVEGRYKMPLSDLRVKASVEQLHEVAAYILDQEIAF